MNGSGRPGCERDVDRSGGRDGPESSARHKGSCRHPSPPLHPKKSLPTPVFEGRAARTLLAELLLLELVVVELLLLGFESSPSVLLELLVADFFLSFFGWRAEFFGQRDEFCGYVWLSS